jgi:hypothetical protein
VSKADTIGHDGHYTDADVNALTIKKPPKRHSRRQTATLSSYGKEAVLSRDWQPSIRHDLPGSALTAISMNGKRCVKSFPLRVIETHKVDEDYFRNDILPCQTIHD